MCGAAAQLQEAGASGGSSHPNVLAAGRGEGVSPNFTESAPFFVRKAFPYGRLVMRFFGKRLKCNLMEQKLPVMRRSVADRVRILLKAVNNS